MSLTLAITWPAAALSNPVLDAGFGDNMVLQSGAPLTLSGRAKPATTVTLQLDNRATTTESDANGAFLVILPAQSNSGAPHTLTISDSSGSTTYRNILIGNVFLCGGQSNMELSVDRALDVYNQLRLAADDGIRLLMVPKATAPVPQAQFASPVTWTPATSRCASASS